MNIAERILFILMAGMVGVDWLFMTQTGEFLHQLIGLSVCVGGVLYVLLVWLNRKKGLAGAARSRGSRLGLPAAVCFGILLLGASGVLLNSDAYWGSSKLAALHMMIAWLTVGALLWQAVMAWRVKRSDY